MEKNQNMRVHLFSNRKICDNKCFKELSKSYRRSCLYIRYRNGKYGIGIIHLEYNLNDLSVKKEYEGTARVMGF